MPRGSRCSANSVFDATARSSLGDDQHHARKKAVPDIQHRLLNFVQISSNQACLAREAFAGETSPSEAPLRFA